MADKKKPVKKSSKNQNGDKLKAYLEKNAISYESLAAHSRTSVRSVYRWVAGKKPQSLATRESIEKFTHGHVSAASW